MRRKLKFFTAVLIAMLCLDLSAQDLNGKWGVSGETPDGRKYNGLIEMKAESDSLYYFQWTRDFEDGSSSEQLSGTGLYDIKTNEMIVGYGIGGSRYGLFEYQLNDQGGLNGSSSWASESGFGAEMVTVELGRGFIVGTYDVMGLTADGDVKDDVKPTYEGILKIGQSDKLYQLQWDLGDGVPFGGFGYKMNRNLIGVWGIAEAFGFEVIKFNKAKNKANVKWMSPSFNYKEAKEKLERK